MYIIYATNTLSDKDKIKQKLVKYFENKTKSLKKQMNLYLKKQNWNEAYKIYTTIISEIGFKNIVYDYLIILLTYINKIAIINDDMLHNISILVNNYFSYFENNTQTTNIINIMMIFIRKNYTNIKLNEISNLIGTFFNKLYVKYKSHNMYVNELIELNEIQDKRNLLFIFNLFKQYQIIGAISQLQPIIKSKSNDDVLRLRFRILIAFKQYKAAQLFIESLQKDNLIDEFTKILNNHM